MTYIIYIIIYIQCFLECIFETRHVSDLFATFYQLEEFLASKTLKALCRCQVDFLEWSFQGLATKFTKLRY